MMLLRSVAELKGPGDLQHPGNDAYKCINSLTMHWCAFCTFDDAPAVFPTISNQQQDLEFQGVTVSSASSWLNAP